MIGLLAARAGLAPSLAFELSVIWRVELGVLQVTTIPALVFSPPSVFLLRICGLSADPTNEVRVTH